MDIVLGFPETEEGYCGLLIISEYVTKYPWTDKIKSKSAREVAKLLFTYKSIFGPPKEIVSDQGKEFVNQVIAHLLALTGT